MTYHRLFTLIGRLRDQVTELASDPRFLEQNREFAAAACLGEARKLIGSANATLERNMEDETGDAL